MSLTQLSPLTFALGLAALAGILYALQRLRVRHEERVVITTLFWREATEESRARSLVERFRHPLAYAMAVLVASLLWFGVAGPDSERSSGTRHVLLLDASAGMAAGERFAEAVEALEDELAAAPRDRTEVLWCGAQVRTILAAGEDRALLNARLDGLAPEAVPASVARAIATLARCEDASGTATARRYVVIGDAPIGAELVARLGETDSVERVDLGEPPALTPGITAFGVAPSASGDWSTVDVLVDVRGRDAGSIWPANFGDAPVRGLQEGGLSEPVGPGHQRFTISDVPADGRRIGYSVDDGAEPGLDDAVALRLPDRAPIRVALDASLPPSVAEPLRAALAADPAVLFAVPGTEADVSIGGPVGANTPSLSIVPAEDQLESILIGHSADVASEDALVAAVGELGLDRLDASALADALKRPVSVGAAPASARSVSLWAELFDLERATFVESRAFPLLVGRAVRWLADVEPVVPYVAAGRPIPHRIGAAPTAARLAGVPGDDGVSLLDVTTTTGRAPFPAAELDESDPEGAGPWRPATWLLFLALVALGVEWALFQRGRMP